MSEHIKEQRDVLEVFDALSRARFIEDQPHAELLTQVADTRVLLISFRAGQLLKEHQVSHNILVQTLQGTVEFRTAEKSVVLRPGMILQLDANISHNVLAQTEAILLITRL
jgi:quercetin dioxygenase-like cupin family protein